MNVYTGSAWVAAYVSAAGVLLIANNLSDLNSVSTARTNLGITDILENPQTITTNYTVTASKNALAVGPITINTGIFATVGTGQRWLILN
jgi:CO dehydrogenase/acetyl-CoA synthase gamma subunit (corrinoid Fe-S protein)